MLGTHSGFIACKDPDFPQFVSSHCVFHQQALVGKAVDVPRVMTLVTRIVNSISEGATDRLFKSLLDEAEAVYGDLILHADVQQSAAAVA